jgi:serine/threonine-protein kinase
MKKFIADILTSAIVTLVVLLLNYMGVIPWGKIIPIHTVPHLKGLTRDSAEVVCSAQNIKFEVADEIFSNEYAKGKVVSQDPEGNARSKFPEVEVVLSKGSQVAYVPDLKGISLEEAIEMLKSLSLTVGSTGFEYSDVDKGKVVSSSPQAGEEVDYNKAINIVVSKGNKSLVVPRVMGKSLSSAKKILKTKGLTLGYVKKETDIERIFGVILRQHPAPGKQVPYGTSITVVVNEEEE